MELLVFKKYHEQEQANELVSFLRAEGIDVEITEHRESLDALYGDKHLNKTYFVKISAADFAKADAALARQSEQQLAITDKDHYLYDFTDEELFEILSKRDEWNEFDFHLSKKILRERGKEVSDATIDLLKKQRLNELAKPEEGQRKWIFAGYMFALLGGIIGVFIGWHLTTYKRTLPNGQQVYGYRKEDRKHGRIIWIVGTIMFTISLVAKFASME